MPCPLAIGFLVAITFVVAADASRSAADESLMSAGVAKRLGLVESWQRTINAPGGVTSIVDQQLFVHETAPNQYVELIEAATSDKAAANETKTAKKPEPTLAADADADADAVKPDDAAPVDDAKVLMRIAVGTPNALGKPIDQKEAERLAGNEIRRMKRRGIDATMRTTEVRRVVLYSIANDGLLESRDAETGQPIWMSYVGRSGLPYRELGVSEDYITIVNGANVIEVDAKTGEITDEHRTIGIPEFGAVNAGEFAMIATLGGGIEGYPMRDPLADPFRKRVAGHAMGTPIKSTSSDKVAWATDRNFVYVMELDGQPYELFRLHTDGKVIGGIAAADGDRFFFATDAGQVYGIRATRSGEVLWASPFGEPFFEKPLVLEDQLFVLSTYGRLFALETESGNTMWAEPVSNVGSILGGFGDQLFVRTMGGAICP